MKNMKNMKRIVLTGPESTGKTSLAAQLAQHFRTEFIAEFAREFIDTLNRPYQETDLLAIAKGQRQKELFSLKNEKISEKNSDLLICDTDLRVIRIWSIYKYGTCDAWIKAEINQTNTDLYLLCKPDIPWIADEQRENPTDREELYDRYKNELIADKQDFIEIEGDYQNRLEIAIRAIETLRKGKLQVF